VRPLALSGVYKNMTRGIIALVFRCEVVSGQPRPTAEAAETRFLATDEIEKLMDEAYACRLLDALVLRYRFAPMTELRCSRRAPQDRPAITDTRADKP
jgi:hypothetical protein